MSFSTRILLSSLISMSLYVANDISCMDKSFSQSYFYMEEVCDNGVDDDGDGLIDAFDVDCSCEVFSTDNLVSNGDFEMSTGCCFTMDQKNTCLTDWEVVTTSPDYHQVGCGYADLALLDEAGIIYDGSFVGFGQAGSQRTESIGTCLRSLLEEGSSYKLSISLAALENIAYDLEEDINIVVYGLQNCSDLAEYDISIPFCQSQISSSAVELFKVNMNSFPNNVMEKFDHEFVAQTGISAILIHSECGQQISGNSFAYFYMDNVEIYSAGSTFNYDSQISTIDNDCSLAFPRIAVEEQPGISFQWYRDSVPILNATHSSFGISSEHNRDIKYHVLASGDGGCKLIGPYRFEGNNIEYLVDTICLGDQYMLGDTVLMTAGTYSRNLGVTSLGCDSIINLELSVVPPQEEGFVISPALTAPIGEVISVEPDVDFLDNIESFYWELDNSTERSYVSQYDTVSAEALVLPLTFHYIDINECSGSVPIVMEWTRSDSDDEICNNGIDDDGDGFIDIFDTDCNCVAISNTSKYTMTGDVCSEEMLVTTQMIQGATYQWYNDEVAMNGEVGNSLTFTKDLYTSEFYVSVMEADACSLIGPIIARRGELDLVINDSFCEGYAYDFNGRMVTESGPYQLISNDEFGCLVSTTLNLTKIPTVYHSFMETICTGDVYSFKGEDLSVSGTYRDTLFGLSSVGCDSIIELNLVVDNEILVQVMDTIYIGESYLFDDQQLSLTGVYRDTIHSEVNCDSIVVLSLEVLDVEVKVEIEDMVLDLYIPNVFNPVGGSDNSKFMIYADRDVKVKEMQIYDRWGNEVYQRIDFIIDDDKGSSWDGTFNGQLVAEGVYSYKIILEDDGVGDDYFQGQLLLVY